MGAIQLTTNAILNKSKQVAKYALLADPVVGNSNAVESLLNTMIEFQNEYLDIKLRNSKWHPLILNPL